jgi:hypothetical protein
MSAPEPRFRQAKLLDAGGFQLTGAARQDNVIRRWRSSSLPRSPAPGAALCRDAVSSQDTGEDRDGHQPLAWYGDSAYGTGNLHDTIGKAGH